MPLIFKSWNGYYINRTNKIIQLSKLLVKTQTKQYKKTNKQTKNQVINIIRTDRAKNIPWQSNKI